MEEIQAKLDALFPENDFYFFDAKGVNKEQEESEVKRLISDSLSAQKCFIQKGSLEPIHHQEGERKIIIDQFMSLLSRCTEEMLEQRRMFKEASQLDIPTEISDHLNGLIQLDLKFKLLAKEKPWALQKISLQGIILVKECI